MTDDEEFIAGFLEVFEKNPQIFVVEQPGAVDALKNLSNTISERTYKSNEEVAHAIGEWCEKYPAITNEINEINEIILYKKLEPKPLKKEGQESMLSNRYPSLPENVRNRLAKSQPPREEAGFDTARQSGRGFNPYLKAKVLLHRTEELIN